MDKYKQVDGQLILMSETDIQTLDINYHPTYRELRSFKYIQDVGTIEDQLDMIYWDMINGTTIWKDKITEIKNKYPKN